MDPRNNKSWILLFLKRGEPEHTHVNNSKGSYREMSGILIYWI
jgi:hypothetical protein